MLLLPLGLILYLKYKATNGMLKLGNTPVGVWSILIFRQAGLHAAH